MSAKKNNFKLPLFDNWYKKIPEEKKKAFSLYCTDKNINRFFVLALCKVLVQILC